MKNKIFTKKANISYFQIILLVLSSVAVSYLIYSETPLVSAEGAGNICCEKTKSGEWCQNDAQENCDGNFKTSPTECKDTEYCKSGCCISSQTGVCNENSPKRNCEGSGFREGSCSSIKECKKGCCTLGNNAEWITEKNCQEKYKYLGISGPVNFSREVKSDVKCIFSVEKGKQGACILNEERSCKYITLEECNTRTKNKADVNPNFFAEKLCSDSSLNTTCKLEKKESAKGCIEGKDDVYYFDSCGNPDIVAKDCNIFQGTYCGKESGNYICKNVNCIAKDGKERKNGESWCDYDGAIGIDKSAGVQDLYGRDPAGSRHVRHICYMGEERIEPCADFRNGICVETKTSLSGGEKISQAACRVNNWRTCLSYNGGEGENKAIKRDKCLKNPDCFVKKVDMGSNFNFEACLPKYPPGFELKIDEKKLMDENYKSPAEGICSMASQKCTEVWVKPCIFCSWKCKVNCGCHEARFTKAMNEFCVSLGDCGGYVNYDGVYNDEGYNVGASWKNPGRLKNNEIDKYKKNAVHQPNQDPAEPGDLNFLGSLVSPDGNFSLLSEVPGALGTSLLVKILSEKSGDIGGSAEFVSPTAVGAAGFGDKTASFKAETDVNFKLKKILGMSPGQLIGAVVGIIGLLMGSIMLMAIGLILFFILGVQVKYNHVDFKCLSWQPPLEGNCNKCNSDIFCSDYRCNSLGKNCELINKGTGDELCVAKKIEASVPQIKPWDGTIEGVSLGRLPTEGYSYFNVKDNGFEIVNSSNKGCIEAFKTVKYGIQTFNTNGTPQNTQCKFDVDASKPFEEMANYFDEAHPNSYLPAHRMAWFLPSPEAFKNQYNLTDEQIKKLGKLKFYVRCKNLKGTQNANPFEIKVCVSPGPDLTAPVITKAEPPSGTKIKYGINEQSLKIYINEPSKCKWSRDNNKNFDGMENSFVCDNDLESYTNYGLACTTTLTGIQNNSQFFIRCKDISKNNNTMSDSYPYELIVSSSELIIKNMKPSNNEEIIAGVEPLEAMLRLETAGGAEDGVSVCEWEGNGFSDRFTETNSSFHSYEWKYATRGNYNLNFMCGDIAGNNATATSSFSIIIDESGPRITRIYNSGGLKITTNEKAECRYDFSRNFIFENATLMSGDGFEHIADWRMSKYYMQCKDDFGNKGGVFQVKAY